MVLNNSLLPTLPSVVTQSLYFENVFWSAHLLLLRPYVSMMLVSNPEAFLPMSILLILDLLEADAKQHLY